ncbi:MAG: AAA family ATPase [Weeksellaceae bacterium]
MTIERKDRSEYRDLIHTNWWVVTGGPSTGKSTVLKALALRGYPIMTEAAGDYIDERIFWGKTIEEIRANERAFQISVLRMKEQREDMLPANELMLFDRSLHADTFAYMGMIPLMENDNSSDVVTVVKKRYQGVFLLDPLDVYEENYARTEDAQQANRIHIAIGNANRLLGYEPINVPVLPIQERAQFIIDYMRSVDPNIPNLPDPFAAVRQLQLEGL